MQKTLIKQALATDKPVQGITLCGWIRTRRDGKDVTFVELNDGSCLTNMQCIVDPKSQAFAELGSASRGASVCITGNLEPSPGKGQQWEVQVTAVQVFGDADPEAYPLQKKRHTDEFLRSIAHLRVRTNKYSAVFRIRSEASAAIHAFFRRMGFHYVHTPILTGSDCEGAGEMFRVTTLSPGEKDLFKDFFGRQASLTVSGQLEAEALAMGLGRVYTFGPTFRAENSNTPRHVAEFWMVEPEMAFADLGDIMDLGEELVQSVVDELLSSSAEDLRLFDRFVEPGLLGRLKDLAARPFARVSYGEAVEILERSGRDFAFPVTYGIDLQTEHERYLAEEHFGRPTIVTDYPMSIKAFYMRVNDDGETVAAMDMLVPRIGELIGGSQREERLDVLKDRMLALGQQMSDYSWYLDLREFGSAPHAGFGLGFERLIMMLTGIANIRDVLPFPRTPGSIEF